MKFDENKILKALKKHDTEKLSVIYDAYENAFINWVIKDFGVDRDLAVDTYADAVLDFYENLVNGTYTKRKGASLKTYIFDIGKYKLLNINKRRDIHKSKENDITE